MDLINYYRLRKLASRGDVDKGVIIGSVGTGAGILGGLGTEYALLKNKRYTGMIDRRLEKAVSALARGNKLKALGNAMLAGLAVGAPAGVGSGLGAVAGTAIPAKLMGVKLDR